MVAPAILLPHPAVPLPSPAVRRQGYGPVRFTVADALDMVERGIIPEDSTIELLDGSLVYRDRFDLKGDEIVEGVKHNFVISSLAELGGAINSDRRRIRTQSTLICLTAHAPIPDAMVLRGSLADYRERLPSAGDTYCVIEVAFSSYERDVGEKLIHYAQAGVQQYIVINLRNRTGEVRAVPNVAAGTYPEPRVVAETELLPIRVGDHEYFEVRLSDLLP